MNPWQLSHLSRAEEDEKEESDPILYSREVQRRQGYGWLAHVKREAKRAEEELVSVRRRQKALGVGTLPSVQGEHRAPPRALQRAIDFYINPTEHSRFVSAKPSTSLWQHQRRGADFMREREREGSPSGGIIAYKMRAGKTLMIAAAILEDLQALVRAGGRRFGEPTLFIVPKQALGTIESEFAKHFGGPGSSPLNVAVISSKRPFLAQSMNWAQELVGSYDVIITSYSRITASYSRSERHGAQTLLDLRYRRVVADEAHVFCNQDNKLFRAMMSIDARFRWFVTGTPIRNSASDLLSPMAFLRVPREDVESVDSDGFRALLRRVMIRQVDNDPAADEEAPAGVPKACVIHDNVVHLEFASDIERQLYTQIQTHTRKLLRTPRRRGKGEEAASKLTLILRLRQICTDPHLLAMVTTYSMRTRYVFERFGSETWTVDGFLHDVVTAEDLRPPSVGTMPLPSDPRHVLLAPLDLPAIKQRLGRIVPLVSTKMRYILQYYEKHIEHSNEKLIVFSSWANFIERLGHVFTKRDSLRGKARASHLMVHGKVENREQVFDAFRQDDTYNVLLLTTGTGGVSLDLSRANHVILADLWFNPFTEEQAISRVLGHNQPLPVHINRLCMLDTIDEQILRLHDSKRGLQSMLPGHETDPAAQAEKLNENATSFLVAWILDQEAVANSTDTKERRGIKRKYSE